MTEYSLPIVPRFAEIDQQNVVFNAHYLTWFDEAVTGYFDHLGVSYPDLMSADLDMQVVHTEIDYAAPVRWRDTVRVAVVTESGTPAGFLFANPSSPYVVAVKTRPPGFSVKVTTTSSTGVVPFRMYASRVKTPSVPQPA